MLVVGLLFAKTVYTELEVDTEMQHGLLPGSLALAAKFVPTMKQASPCRVGVRRCSMYYLYTGCLCDSCSRDMVIRLDMWLYQSVSA